MQVNALVTIRPWVERREAKRTPWRWSPALAPEAPHSATAPAPKRGVTLARELSNDGAVPSALCSLRAQCEQLTAAGLSIELQKQTLHAFGMFEPIINSTRIHSGSRS